MLEKEVLIIKPYDKEGTWVFDDPTRDLVQEPFVSGIPEMISDLLVQNKINVKEAKKGFLLIFSKHPFPNYHTVVENDGEENGGCWYKNKTTDRRGWLCPVLFTYFNYAPPKLYISVQEINHENI